MKKLLLCTLATLSLHMQAVACQEEVVLQRQQLTDPVHGGQKIGSTDPVTVGLPAVYSAEVEFTLPPGTSVRGLVAFWRSASNGVARATTRLEMESGGLVPREWYGDQWIDEPVLTITRYDGATGYGQARIDLPVGRIQSSRVFPSLDATAGELDVLVGLAGTMSVDRDTQIVSGALMSAHTTFPTTSGQVMIDITEPWAPGGTPIGAFIECGSSSQDPRTFDLRCTVDGMIAGLPTSVTIPANERRVVIEFSPIGDGTYQIEALSQGAIVGYSTLASVGATNNSHTASGDSNIGNGYDYDTKLAELPEHPPHWPYHITTEYCIPAQILTRNAMDKCGECKNTPLSEADKPDCPDIQLFHLAARCQRGRWSSGDDMTSCGTFQEPQDVSVYEWTGTRGEYTCESAATGVSYIISFEWVWEKAQSCCVYRKDRNGATEEVIVGNCRTTAN